MKVILQIWGGVPCMIRIQTKTGNFKNSNSCAWRGVAVCLGDMATDRGQGRPIKEAEERGAEEHTSCKANLSTSMFTTATATSTGSSHLHLRGHTGDPRTGLTFSTCWIYERDFLPYRPHLPCEILVSVRLLLWIWFLPILLGEISPGTLLRSTGILQTKAMRNQMPSKCLGALCVHSRLYI